MRERSHYWAAAVSFMAGLAAGIALLLETTHDPTPARAVAPLEVSPPAASVPAPEQAARDVRVFAYYYISHTEDSWWRNKRDLPALGRYPSDSPEAIREHVRMARDAGISAFIVHWRATEELNHRLDLLVQEARTQNFKLAIFYAALDDRRHALPIAQVAADLDFFAERWGRDPVFDVFGQPLVIVEGTWEFSVPELTLLSGQHRTDHERDPVDHGQTRGLLLLASERDVEGYQRLDGLVDGNAYYWSSADPSRRQPHLDRLLSIRDAVGDGLWLAPAAPGFDASLLGATRIIDRAEGRTFQDALETARESNADAIAVISWNEFDENTHIEPSARLGTRALEVLANFTGGHAPATVARIEGFSTQPQPSTLTDDTLSFARAWPTLGVLTLFLGAAVGAFWYGLNVRRPPRVAD
jgi:hypothetical protein